MTNISVDYLGLKLKSPIIAASSGLTISVDNIIQAEKYGAGAVVLKSLYEEQISYNANKLNAENLYSYPEAEQYIQNYTQQHEFDEYIKIIREAKQKVSIPIIASINCISANQWTDYVKKIQTAGADAIELNIFKLPTDVEKDSHFYEHIYFDIVDKISNIVTTPIALKVSSYFSSLANTVYKLSKRNISGIVLFNRFFTPDIDIDKFEIISAPIYSTPNDIYHTLRWVGILSDKINIDISASTGIHDSKGAIKMLLAGAKTCQLCSTIYSHGFEVFESINNDIQTWMQKHNFETIEDFRGKMNMKKIEHPNEYFRIQFMKYFAGIE